MGDVPFTSVGSEFHPENAGHSLTSKHGNHLVHCIMSCAYLCDETLYIRCVSLKLLMF